MTAAGPSRAIGAEEPACVSVCPVEMVGGHAIVTFLTDPEIISLAGSQ